MQCSTVHESSVQYMKVLYSMYLYVQYCPAQSSIITSTQYCRATGLLHSVRRTELTVQYCIQERGLYCAPRARRSIPETVAAFLFFFFFCCGGYPGRSSIPWGRRPTVAGCEINAIAGGRLGHSQPLLQHLDTVLAKSQHLLRATAANEHFSRKQMPRVIHYHKSPLPSQAHA